MRPQWTKLKGIALDLFFPQKCLGCGKEGSLLCSSCCQSLPRIVPPICPRCGRPQSGGVICPACVSWNSELDGIRSPLQFEGLVRRAIHDLKYNNIRALSKPMSVILKEYLAESLVPGEVLVPVPLHPKRMRERGYNQSALLAYGLGKLAGLPVSDDCLIRTRVTPPQARTASVDERRHNVEKAFACRNQGLSGKRVIVVDDVSTSGATVSACARALKEAGAKSVWALVLAREI